MAHKFSALLIAAFATLAVASLIAVGAATAMAGQGVNVSANGDCDRTMDKLHAQDGTCDGTGLQSGTQTQDRTYDRLMTKQMDQDRLKDGSCLVA